MSQQADKNSPSPELEFILGAAPVRFNWTVRVPVPKDDDYVVVKLPLQFEAVDQTELNRFRGIGLADGEQVPSDVEIARQVVKGWPVLRNAEGSLVPFSEAKLEQLLRHPVMATAIAATYLAAMNGVAARKNA
ncbi:hypothetical protein [Paucibacter sp. B51]|uniref:hypothetical protein n=1 Tax=Paucibacter sp. B51 TaxID=2993315 RepID=UPI0022EBE576|nr:hypothetical protein [Paucibacter sp. B51]